MSELRTTQPRVEWRDQTFSPPNKSSMEENPINLQDNSQSSFNSSAFTNLKDQSPVKPAVRQANTNQESKRPETAGMSKTQKIQAKPSKNFNNLSEKQKTEAYYDLYDSNLDLKSKQNQLEERVKQLTTQLTRIVTDIKYERDLVANSSGGEVKAKIDLLTEEKERFAKENLELKQKLKEISSSRQGKSSRQGTQKVGSSLSKFKTQPAVMANEKRYEECLEQRDKLIEKLKEQLQHTEIELLRSKGDRGLATDLSDEYKERSIQLGDLHDKFRDLEEQFLTQKTYLELTKKMLEETQVSLRDERITSSELQIRLRAAEMTSKGSKDIALKLREVVDENKQLESRLKELCNSPFIKESGDRVLIGSKITILEKELQEKLNELNFCKQKLLITESEIARTKQELELTNIEKTKLKEENIVMNVKLSERGKYVDDFDDKLKMLVKEKDSEAFMKALGMMKLEGEQPVWSQVDMIERAQEVPDDIPGLQREIERLKIEKGDLAAELEKYQSLITLKAQIEVEKTTLIKAENENLKFQLRSASKRIEELSKLSDYRGKKLKEFAKLQGLKPFIQNIPKEIENFEMGGGFIEGGTEVDTGENVFDLLLIDANYNVNNLPSNLKKLDEFVTFLTTDFFNHETQITSLSEGLGPKFNLHISFKIAVDNLFIKYLQTESLAIDAHISVGDRYITIGKAKIPLSVLINVSRVENTSRVIESACVFYSAFDEKVVIGGLRYKLRMRYPLSEIFEYYEEQDLELERPSSIHSYNPSA